jgi:hypothetical protein
MMAVELLLFDSARLCLRAFHTIADLLQSRRCGQSCWRDLMSAARDIDLGGILVAPFVRYLFLALVILIAVRFAVGRFGSRLMFANPPLAEAGLYVCILF